jgi:6-phosphogluconolactonase
MSQPALRVFQSYEELSRAAAARFVEVARMRLAAGDVLSVALSGGGTPRGFLECLAKAEYSGQVDWERVHLFQVDERPVPPDHADSNYRMIREVFLNRVERASPNFHRMQTEDQELDRAARAYQDVLAQSLRTPKGQVPRLDLIFLGMGSDGHTASLFPQSPALGERVRWVRPNYVAKLQSYRLTLTYPVLNAGREVIFLVSGTEKAQILKSVLEGSRRVEQLPSQGIEPVAGNVFWYLDSQAAGLLNERARSGD